MVVSVRSRSGPAPMKVSWILVLLVATSLAGCLGGDDDPEPAPEPDDVQTAPPEEDQNITSEPPPLPVAELDVAVTIGGDEAQAPFVAGEGTEVTIILDGGASRVDNGTIETYSWTLHRPDGSTEKTETLQSAHTITIDGTDYPDDYGVYVATLLVVTDEDQTDAAMVPFALSYNATITFAHDMLFGPATDCGGELPQSQAGDDLAGTGIVQGTFTNHSIQLSANATNIHVGLDFTTDAPETQMKLYLFDADGGEDDCSDAIAESNADSESATLSANINANETMELSLRVQMIGLFVTGYTLNIDVVYSVPDDLLENVDLGDRPPVEIVQAAADHALSIDKGSACHTDEFKPATQTIAPGETVNWKHDGHGGGALEGDCPHNIKIDDHPDTVTANFLHGQTSQTIRFNHEGNYAYHCEIHPGMKGTIEVS